MAKSTATIGSRMLLGVTGIAKDPYSPTAAGASSPSFSRRITRWHRSSELHNT